MIATEPILMRNGFSKEAIQQQMQKIIADPIFEGSDILKRFLLFIVSETLSEHANKLKEYTIARNVLNKPADFKPRESGIVRIHAGRLRRALSYYYGENGLLDSIRISIPKGSYVPEFGSNEDDLPSRMMLSRKSVIVGVVPFRCLPENETVGSFGDGLAVQLSQALMSLQDFSVVAYYTMQNLMSNLSSVDQVVSTVGARFLITGDIQVVQKTLRIHLQMIKTRSSQLIWSQMYERKFNPLDIFSIQDDIVKNMISELGSLAM